MAYVVLVIDVNDNQSEQAYTNILNGSGDASDALNACNNLITSINAGAKSGTVQVTVTNAAPSITPAGTGSSQVTYNKI